MLQVCQLPFYQLTILPIDHFASWLFCQLTILPVDNFSSWPFYHLTILPVDHFASWLISVLTNLPFDHFATWLFCPLTILLVAKFHARWQFCQLTLCQIYQLPFLPVDDFVILFFKRKICLQAMLGFHASTVEGNYIMKIKTTSDFDFDLYQGFK